MILPRSSLAGMLWTAGGRVAVRGVQFVVGIFLARLLTPADFGLVGMLGVFIGVSEMFVDCGFSLALIRKMDRTDADASTVFWFSVCVSLVCYAALFVAAPAIASFFGALTGLTKGMFPQAVRISFPFPNRKKCRRLLRGRKRSMPGYCSLPCSCTRWV